MYGCRYVNTSFIWVEGMKLFELTGIKHLKNKTPKELVDYVNTMHYGKGLTNLRLLGTGANGVALTDGTNVFKFWHTDSAYMRFVEHCNKHKGNKFLPVFKSGVKHLPLNISSEYYEDGETKKRTGVNYIKMELLDQIDVGYKFKIFKDSVYNTIQFNQDEIGPLLSEIPNNTISLLMLLEDIRSIRYKLDLGKEEAVLSVLQECSTNSGFISTFGINAYDVEIVEFTETIFDLVGSLGSVGMWDDYFDFHYGNFAMRGEQLVILDPFANVSDIDINKIVLQSLR